MARISLKKDKTSNVKARNWTFIGYPESMPDNWKDILTATGLDIFISPIHDKDFNADGSKKKPHYHIMLCYSGPTSFNVVKRITERLNATIPQVVSNVKGLYRYFTHEDNPEKEPYDKKDILALNGASIGDYIELTKSEILKMKLEIVDWIEKRDILEYRDLLVSLKDCGELELFDFASNHTLLFYNYISSKRNKFKNKG